MRLTGRRKTVTGGRSSHPLGVYLLLCWSTETSLLVQILWGIIRILNPCIVLSWATCWGSVFSEQSRRARTRRHPPQDNKQANVASIIALYAHCDAFSERIWHLWHVMLSHCICCGLESPVFKSRRPGASANIII